MGYKLKIPRLKIRKMTRAVVGGIIIAIGSLYALSVSYDIPRMTLLGYLLGSVLLVLAMSLAAITVVFIIKLAMKFIQRLRASDTDENGQD